MTTDQACRQGPGTLAYDACHAPQEQQIAALRALIDAACAVMRLPDTTNDGGPGDLAEELRNLKHNWEDAETRCEQAEAERDRLAAQIADYEKRPWPGCRILSAGEGCICTLCVTERERDRLAAALAAKDAECYQKLLKAEQDYLAETERLAATVAAKDAALDAAALWLTTDGRLGAMTVRDLLARLRAARERQP